MSVPVYIWMHMALHMVMHMVMLSGERSGLVLGRYDEVGLQLGSLERLQDFVKD
jgi:hypothetical protein